MGTARGMLVALAAWGALGCGAAARAYDSGDHPVGTSRGGASRPDGVDLVLARPDGTTVALSSLRGRAVLVVAFLLDNLAAQAMLRNVERVARAHPADLVALAVAGDEHPFAEEAVMVETYGRVLELTHVGLTLADDAIREGNSPLGAIVRVPTSFLVNRAGAIARRVEGYQTEAELEALVAPALPPRTAAAAGP